VEFRQTRPPNPYTVSEALTLTPSETNIKRPLDEYTTNSKSIDNDNPTEDSDFEPFSSRQTASPKKRCRIVKSCSDDDTPDDSDIDYKNDFEGVEEDESRLKELYPPHYLH
jgi:hypothetical protein